MAALHKAVSIACAAAWLLTAYDLVIRPWHLGWGATEDEVRRGPDRAAATSTVRSR